MTFDTRMRARTPSTAVNIRSHLQSERQGGGGALACHQISVHDYFFSDELWDFACISRWLGGGGAFAFRGKPQLNLHCIITCYADNYNPRELS